MKEVRDYSQASFSINKKGVSAILKIREVKFSEIGNKKRKKTLFEDFSVALRYSALVVEGEPIKKWVTKEIEKLGMGYIPYELNAKGNFWFMHFETVEDVGAVASILLETEQSVGNRKILEDAIKKTEMIAEITPGERNFFLDYGRGRLEIIWNDFFLLTSLMKKEEFEERIRLMIEISKKDADLQRLNAEELKMRTLFGQNESVFFEVDYALEKYFDKKEKEFDEFVRYTQKRILETEKKIALKLEELGAIEEIEKKLIKHGRLIEINGKKTSLKNPIE